MKIKKIRAKSFREALTLVKKELGSDAVILSSEDKQDKGSYVEVTAAIDYDIEAQDTDYGALSEGSMNDDSNRTHQERGSVYSEEYGDLKKEIMSLRSHIESMKNTGFSFIIPKEKKQAFEYLRKLSIREEYALGLVERADAIGEIETVMTDDLTHAKTSKGPFSDIRDISAKRDSRVTMLIGPTGSGKTTSIAKLASMAIKEGKRVGLISIDTYKIGAAEQIRIYSRMIGIPLDIISDRESFRKSIRRFSDKDVVLVDTSGQNPKDVEYIDNLKKIYQIGIPMETQLLMSASSDCDFLMDTHKYYSSLPVDCMAFTKTDEAVKLGSIYNLCRLYQKPVAYITTGQRVPGNLEYVDSKKLANLILKTGSL